MLPQDLEHFTDPTYISTGARAAYELGADVLKVYYTGNDSFRTIVDSVAIPVVIAGGPKDKDAFVMAKRKQSSLEQRELPLVEMSFRQRIP